MRRVEEVTFDVAALILVICAILLAVGVFSFTPLSVGLLFILTTVELKFS